MRYLVLHKSYTKVIKLFLCFLPFHLSCPCQCFCPVQLLQYLTPPFNLIKDVKVILCLCVCSTNPPFPIFALRCPTSWPICCLWSHDAKCRNFILDFPNFQVSLEVVEKQPATFTWTCPTCQAGSWQGISTCPTCKAGSWVLTWQLHLINLLTIPKPQFASILTELQKPSRRRGRLPACWCSWDLSDCHNQLYCNGSEGLVMADQNTKWLLFSENTTNKS